MKKRGVTLVELIAVMAIMSVIFVAIGGLYVTGIKRSENTKINGDIENGYRNFYQVVKDTINKNKGDIQIFYNNESKQGKNFSVVAGTNNNFINEGKKDGYSIQEAYLAIKNSKDDKEEILVSFGNGTARAFYMIEVNEKNVQYDTDNNSNQDNMNITGEIISYKKLCDDVTKFNINEKNNVYYFYVQYSKDGIVRDYDFSVNKNDDRVVTVSENSKDIQDNDDIEGDNSQKNLENFYKQMGSLTLLKDTGKVRLNNSDLTFSGNSTYYFSGLLNNKYNDISKKFIGNGKVYGTYNLNNSNEDDSVKPLNFEFANGNYTNEERTIASIIQEMKYNNIDTVLIKKVNNGYKYYNYKYVSEPIKNFIGAIIKDDNGYIVLINGDVYLQGNIANNLLVYAFGNINIDNSNQYYEDVKFNNCSLVSYKNINMANCSVTIEGKYNVTDNTKKKIEQFLEK